MNKTRFLPQVGESPKQRESHMWGRAASRESPRQGETHRFLTCESPRRSPRFFCHYVCRNR